MARKLNLRIKYREPQRREQMRAALASGLAEAIHPALFDLSRGLSMAIAEANQVLSHVPVAVAVKPRTELEELELLQSELAERIALLRSA